MKNVLFFDEWQNWADEIIIWQDKLLSIIISQDANEYQHTEISAFLSFNPPNHSI